MSNEFEDQRPPMPTPPSQASGGEQHPPMPTPPSQMTGQGDAGQGQQASDSRPPMPTPPSQMSGNDAAQQQAQQANPAGFSQPQQAPAQQPQYQQPQYGQPQFGQMPPQPQYGVPVGGQPATDPAAFVQQQMNPLVPQAPKLLAHAPFQAPWWGFSFAGAVLLWILGGALPFVSASSRDQARAFEGADGWIFLILAIAAGVFGVLNSLKKGGRPAILAPIINTVLYGVLALFVLVAFARSFDVVMGVPIHASVGAYILLLTALAGLGLAIFGIVQSQKMKQAFMPMPPMPPQPPMPQQ